MSALKLMVVVIGVGLAMFALAILVAEVAKQGRRLLKLEQQPKECGAVNGQAQSAPPVSQAPPALQGMPTWSIGHAVETASASGITVGLGKFKSGGQCIKLSIDGIAWCDMSVDIAYYLAEQLKKSADHILNWKLPDGVTSSAAPEATGATGELGK